MTQYRLYYLNTAGHIDHAEIVEAIDDVRAVQICRGRTGTQALELWCRARQVHNFAAEAARVPDALLA